MESVWLWENLQGSHCCMPVEGIKHQLCRQGGLAPHQPLWGMLNKVQSTAASVDGLGRVAHPCKGEGPVEAHGKCTPPGICWDIPQANSPLAEPQRGKSWRKAFLHVLVQTGGLCAAMDLGKRQSQGCCWVSTALVPSWLWCISRSLTLPKEGNNWVKQEVCPGTKLPSRSLMFSFSFCFRGQRGLAPLKQTENEDRGKPALPTPK